MKRLLLVALNEFNVDFFREACARFSLPNIEHILSMRHCLTWTDDETERRGLDPWVQWVSVHTGLPSGKHSVRHLGDVPHLSHAQLWETLSRHKVSSGIWGAMNASRGEADLCSFFLPDPWTFSERAYPEALNGLLALPRYYSRNYLNVSGAQLGQSLLKLLAFVFARPGLCLRLAGQLPIALRGLWRPGLNNQYLFSLFDIVSATVFSYYKGGSRPEFSLIFLNSIAHMQHNSWSSIDRMNASCRFSLQAIDHALGILLRSMEEGEELIVMNGLSQQFVPEGRNDFLYRQVDPARFLNEMGFRYKSVEQLMTNDAHVIFSSSADAIEARGSLESATISGKPMFDVDYDEGAPEKLFFQLDIWDDFPGDVEFRLRGERYQFFDYFEKVVRRTGEHLQSGDLFASALRCPQRMYNHEIHQRILQYFGISPENTMGQAGCEESRVEFNDGSVTETGLQQ